MRFIAIVALSFALFGYPGLADEHPKGSEHPQEHPKGHEHPAKDAKGQTGKGQQKDKKSKNTKDQKGQKGEPTSWNKNKVEQDLKAFIDTQKSQSGGMFTVKDDLAGKERKLTLDKIHTDKIVQLADGTSFVCADFKDAGGESVDVDFFMTPGSGGTLAKVDRVQVHKVNGKARYTYVKNGETWVQQNVN